LVLDAVSGQSTPGHRFRALAILGRIAAGACLDVLSVLDLNGLPFARNKMVREVAHRFFGMATPTTIKAFQSFTADKV
jgi:hypothetical protein